MLPDLVFFSIQCGFVPRRQAAEGVYRIKRILELCKEWNRSVHVVQIDLSKAFDRVLHSSVFQALRLQSASLQCIAVVAAMLNQCELAVRLEHVITEPIKLHRGLPQGAPESPLLFILVCELVLRPLLLKWQVEGMGWLFCDFWLATMGYADDILVFSEKKDDLVKMLEELITTFAKVALDISVEKCAWSSFPPEKQGTLNVCGFNLKWVKSLTFVGAVINFNGNDGEAIMHRLAQAAKSLAAWREYLRSPRAALKKRLKLLFSTVFAFALWMSETWLPTKQQREHLLSWGARMASSVAGYSSSFATLSAAQFWRALHRRGHTLLANMGNTLDGLRLTRVHTFAGHLARSSVPDLSLLLRTRCLSWWRREQARYRSKFGGLHPKRFKCWRWESQITAFYGEPHLPDDGTDVGWMALAKDKTFWKENLGNFLIDSTK